MVGDPQQNLKPSGVLTGDEAVLQPTSTDPPPGASPNGSQIDSQGPEPNAYEELTRARRGLEQLGEIGSVRVALQPIVDLTTTEVIGYEALARFVGDTTISPRAWFAQAAELGLLCEVEIAAIKAALAELGRVPANAFVAVNLSPSTAASKELRDLLSGVDGSRVVLKITEDAAAEGYERISEAVGALRADRGQDRRGRHRLG